MDKYQIESKICIPPSKGKRILCVLLNIYLVLAAFGVLLSIIFDGFSIKKIGGVAVIFIVVTAFKSSVVSSYQFSILDLDIVPNKAVLKYNGVKVGSYTGEVYYEVLAENVSRVEYSRQLNALRFTGKISRTVNRKKQVVEEVVVYCQGEAGSIIHSIEENLEHKVIFMDNTQKE